MIKKYYNVTRSSTLNLMSLMLRTNITTAKNLTDETASVNSASVLNKLIFSMGLFLFAFSIQAQDSLEVLGESINDASKNTNEQGELFHVDLPGIVDFAKEQKNNGASFFELDIKLEGQRWDMILSPSNVLVSEVAGVDQYGNVIDLDTNITYQGYLKGSPDVKVRMTISDELVHALIMDSDNSYVFESSEYNSNTLSVTKVSDSTHPGHLGCGIPEHQHSSPPITDSFGAGSEPSNVEAQSSIDAASPAAVDEIGIAKWAVVCDVECQNFRGSQAGVNADLQTIVNVVNGYYEQYNARYELQPIIFIAGSSNPWVNIPRNTSAHTNSFQGWASQNISVEHNVGMLFTGVDQNGISFAFLGHMCTNDNFRYGMHAYSFPLSIQQKANIVTHELGHLWGAEHINPVDSAFIMNFQIFDGTLQWKNTTQSVINNARAQFDGCLTGGGAVDPYCAVQIGLGAAGTDWINSVAVNGSIIAQDNARSLPRADNTSTVISVTRSATTQLTVNLNNNFNETVVAIYADWNQDNDFNDVGEVVASQKANQSSFNFNITPPNNAATGNTRLRIRLTFDGNNEYGANGQNLPACGQTTFDGGEVEDYTIDVSGGGGSQIPTAPSNLAASAVSSSQVNVSWSDNSNNEINFELQRAPVNSAFFTIASLNSNTTSFADTGLLPNTQYRYRVRATNSAGGSNYSNVGIATTTDDTNPNPVYCASSGGGTYEFISSIDINNFSNDSSADSFTPYTDFTNQIVPLMVGNNSATFTPGYRPNRNDLEAWIVWIDFNQDGDFSDSGERLTNALNGRGIVNANLNIPASTVGVTTRMRISMRFSQEASGSCANFASGEVEDYTVTIGGGNNIPPRAEANGPYSGAPNSTINFSSNGSNDDGSIVSYEWDFGDTNSSNSANPNHGYSLPGSYTATLTVTDDQGAQDIDTAIVTITATGGSSVPDACATGGVITGGRLTPGEAACLNNQSLIWLSVADVSGHSSVAITTGNGTGDFDIEYNNGSWPNAGNSNNSDAVSNNVGNSDECIYITNNPQFWGYIKVTGGGSGTSIIVDFDTAGCRL